MLHTKQYAPRWLLLSREIIMRPLFLIRFLLSSILLAAVPISGCTVIQASAQPSSRNQERSITVDAAIASAGVLQESRAYTGTTKPFREVSLRSQTEGRILELNANAGDPVQAGQVLARLDGAIAVAAVTQAEAEVAAQEAEVASLQAEVEEARTEVERSRLELQQAQSDYQRQAQLLREGAVTEQQAETAKTLVGTAAQTLRSAEKQVSNRQQAVTAAARRIAAQQAIVNQERERLSYNELTSPLTGAVLTRSTEPGNLAQPGTELLRIGDFSRVKVEVQVSELELAGIRVGQSARVQLDAFPNQSFAGEVTRISPVAQARSRLIPIEVTIPNETGAIGSGLLARVRFGQGQARRIIIPESATQIGQKPGAGQASQPRTPSQTATVYVVNRTGKQATVSPREVALGDRADGQVEVLSGLSAGESFVVRSSDALQEGTAVNLSFLSER